MLIKFDRDQINKQRVNMKASIDQMNDIIEKVLLVVYLQRKKEHENFLKTSIENIKVLQEKHGNYKQSLKEKSNKRDLDYRNLLKSLK